MFTHLRQHSPGRRSPVLWVLSASLIAVLACSLGGGAATGTPAPAPTEPPPLATPVAAAETPAPQGPTVTIDIIDNEFTPAALEVAPGTTVIWTHSGARKHTVTADDGSFNSNEMENGAQFQFTFDTAATVAFHCEFHGEAGGGGMAGTITVAAEAGPEPTAATEPTADNSVAGEPGFTALAGPANRDPAQGAQNPALVLGDGPDAVWMAWSEFSGGGARQIFVSQYDGTLLQPRGGSLNLHANVAANQPSITLAGQDRAVPWVAWSEPSPGFGNVAQVFASRFIADTGLWQPAGQDRGGAEPSLNRDTSREATGPVIFGGSTEPGQPPVPWVAWEELSGVSNFVQIFVARGVKDDAALGGFRWELVGENRFNDEPTLNIDPRRDSQHPSAVFAETGNAVPWITWHEVGADRPGRVFTARGVADAKAPGGFKWINVPPCTPDETACALNVNPLNDAAEAAMASGSLVAGDSSLPWIVWPEVGPTGKYQILVSRLDPGTRNSFLNVGGSLNVDQNHDGRDPVIAFVGSVPYVAWLEEDGAGRFVVQVRHLASDPQTGTWALDTPETGFGQEPGQAQTGLFGLGGPERMFLAWANGEPATAQLILGQFQP